jgi:hypothetical protein
MNTLGQQMAIARGGPASASGGQRQALAQACDVAACDPASPFTVWGSALGGVGIGAGRRQCRDLDLQPGRRRGRHRLSRDAQHPARHRRGLYVGNAMGRRLHGQGLEQRSQRGGYGSFTQGGFYADLLAGYAYANNQLQRQIMVPNLQPRTANGSTGVNQFLGQVELGYRCRSMRRPRRR